MQRKTLIMLTRSATASSPSSAHGSSPRFLPCVEEAYQRESLVRAGAVHASGCYFYFQKTRSRMDNFRKAAPEAACRRAARERCRS